MNHPGRHTVDFHNTLPAVPQLQFPSADMQAGQIFLGLNMDHVGENDVWHGMSDAAWDRMSVGELFDAVAEKTRLV